MKPGPTGTQLPNWRRVKPALKRSWKNVCLGSSKRCFTARWANLHVFIHTQVVNRELINLSVQDRLNILGNTRPETANWGIGEMSTNTTTVVGPLNGLDPRIRRRIHRKIIHHDRNSVLRDADVHTATGTSPFAPSPMKPIISPFSNTGPAIIYNRSNLLAAAVV